jgi:putative ABC transport system substrate-binding protein
MRRREFIILLGGAAILPLAARAQQAAMPVVGFLGSGTPAAFAQMAAAFRQGLKESGFIDGQNATIEYRWAEGEYDRLSAQAADLIQRGAAVILASGGVAPTRAARAVTTKIPIVFTTAYDPVAMGLVTSLNRPEGNITGATFFAGLLGGKRLELLRDLVPNVSKVVVLANPSNPVFETEVKEVQSAAEAMGVQLEVMTGITEHEIDAVFANLAQQRREALLIQPDPFLQNRTEQIVALAARTSLPTFYPTREFVEAGGLISYGARMTDAYHQAGIYVGKILKGAKPVELPVVQPTKFELVINIKTAKTLGLTVPMIMQMTADEVIE